ncbi:unnamed protein product [Cyprideis torosa]|uniref:GPN-loop GTPase 2 n=1 Tax=Cyprideis torosa TaxID=163714 RepID=A0A7R8WLM1_9CRUS|nr:unnamed protein product [Cyprideis torosa]CAG0902599.1 unnamed protein product [Cyprideis torosa]
MDSTKPLTKTCFGQVVIGPPGSGKTTYCQAISSFLKELQRDVTIVNLDPANDILPYVASIDVSELIELEDAMEINHLGPNGGLVYCMEYLEEHLEWLIGKIRKKPESYYIFDFPGQVELYTHHRSVRNILDRLAKELDLRLCAVHLVDSHYCSDPGKFISVLLTSLTTMVQLELPHINVLSKIDLAEKYGKLHFGLDYYTDVLDLKYLLDILNEDPITKKYASLNQSLVELIEGYSLVSFLPLDVRKKASLLAIRAAADKANGYVFGSQEERNIQALLSCSEGAGFEWAKLAWIRERFIDDEDTLMDAS